MGVPVSSHSFHQVSNCVPLSGLSVLEVGVVLKCCLVSGIMRLCEYVKLLANTRVGDFVEDPNAEVLPLPFAEPLASGLRIF